jgi:hypothetical protein
MNRNPILEELYAARDKLLADAGGDVHRYLEDVRRREAASGRLLPPSPQQTENGTNATDRGYAGQHSSAASK